MIVLFGTNNFVLVFYSYYILSIFQFYGNSEILSFHARSGTLSHACVRVSVVRRRCRNWKRYNRLFQRNRSSISSRQRSSLVFPCLPSTRIILALTTLKMLFGEMFCYRGDFSRGCNNSGLVGCITSYSCGCWLIVSNPSAADRDSDPQLVVTCTFSRTLAPEHLLWRVPNQLPMYIRARETVSSFKMALKTLLHSVGCIDLNCPGMLRPWLVIILQLAVSYHITCPQPTVTVVYYQITWCMFVLGVVICYEGS